MQQMQQQGQPTPLNLPMAVDTNTPQKERSSYHIQNLIAVLLLYICIGLGVGLYVTKVMPLPFLIIIIIFGYVLNIIISLCCNKTREYFDHLRSFQEYEIAYDNMVNSKAHFKFNIECYHYQTTVTYDTRHDRDGRSRTQRRTHQRKVITHSAHEIITPQLSKDQSGDIQSILETKQLIFFHYIPKHYFSDPFSANNFQMAYSNFIRMNSTDMYQSYSYQFVIPGFEERIGFYTKQKISAVGYYLSVFLGFSYFYAIINELRVARYQISIVKRITM